MHSAVVYKSFAARRSNSFHANQSISQIADFFLGYDWGVELLSCWAVIVWFAYKRRKKEMNLQSCWLFLNEFNRTFRIRMWLLLFACLFSYGFEEVDMWRWLFCYEQWEQQRNQLSQWLLLEKFGSALNHIPFKWPWGLMELCGDGYLCSGRWWWYGGFATEWSSMAEE